MRLVLFGWVSWMFYGLIENGHDWISMGIGWRCAVCVRFFLTSSYCCCLKIYLEPLIICCGVRTGNKEDDDDDDDGGGGDEWWTRS